MQTGKKNKGTRCILFFGQNPLKILEIYKVTPGNPDYARGFDSIESLGVSILSKPLA